MQIQTSPPRMWTLKEAAEATSLSLHYVRKAALTGKISAIRTGTVNSKILVNAESLINYLQSSNLIEEPEIIIIDGIRRIAE